MITHRRVEIDCSRVLGDIRSVPALSYALAWLGSAIGGLAMGPIAERIGVRWTVGFGALMIAIGLAAVEQRGKHRSVYWARRLMGLLGNAGINAPLYVYVSRWFDRRRGTALALIASGQALAGVIWAPLFAYAIEWYGWRHTDAAVRNLARCHDRARRFRGFSNFAQGGDRQHRHCGAERDRVRHAASNGVRPPIRRGFYVLRSDGNAAGSPGRFL